MKVIQVILKICQLLKDYDNQAELTCGGGGTHRTEWMCLQQGPNQKPPSCNHQ